VVILDNRVTQVEIRVNNLETSLAPFIQATDAASSRGESVIIPVAGGSPGGGVMLTQGRGTAKAGLEPTFLVNAAECTTAQGVDSTALGLCAKAGTGNGSETSGATALGSNAWATSFNSTAIGFRSTAKAENSVALGAGSVADQANTVSVGSAGNERRITNLAAGVNGTDAVNMDQLKAAYAGAAMSLALNTTFMPNLTPGKKAVGAGVGYYKGEAAVGVTFKALNESGNSSYGAGVSTNGKDVGVSIGLGWMWE
jgi:autotransporter adhesin